jgi:hypothetical protein
LEKEDSVVTEVMIISDDTDKSMGGGEWERENRTKMGELSILDYVS